MIALWDFAAFIANSLIFLLIGLSRGHAFCRRRCEGPTGRSAWSSLGRALTVYPICLLFWFSARAVPLREQHVLWWGGLRGALALALALVLPPSFPFDNEILVTAFGVVIFSVIVQGLTMPWLMRRLKFYDGNESIRRQP